MVWQHKFVEISQTRRNDALIELSIRLLPQAVL